MKNHLLNLFIFFTLSATTCLAQPCSVSIQVDSTVTCYGACNAGLLAHTSGTAPFTYNWNPGVSSDSVATFLCAGKYIVTMTDDNGCIVMDSVDLTDPDLISATPAVTDVTCHGLCNGTIVLNPNGGTAPYQYLWDNGGTTEDLGGLCIGNFCVHVTDANGCEFDDCDFYINEPDTLDLDIQSLTGGTVIFCHGYTDGSILATINGGVIPYQYDWSTGETVELLNNLGAGTYVLTITDANGCMAMDSLTYTEPEAFSVIYTTSNYHGYGVSCMGDLVGFICASVSGQTPPYNFLWAPTNNTDSCETGIGAGDYCVYITDANGCPTDSCFTVTEPDHFMNSTSYQDPSCPGCLDGEITITPSGGTPPYTYTWTPNISVDSSATGLGAGTYTICATDANGCTACDEITLSDPLSAGDASKNISLTISPNPSDGKFSLLFRSILNNASVRIVNTLGQVIYSDVFNYTTGSSKDIYINAPAGIYFIQISAENAKWTGKIVKE